jgi:hypothetical protein
MYSQIWLNIRRDDCHYLLHLLMDDRHFGYIKNKNPEKDNGQSEPAHPQRMNENWSGTG